MDDNTLTRFWSKVDKTGDCWIWTASGNVWGYGQFWYRGKFIGAHRFAYITKYKSIPPRHDIHHTCRVRGCVKPDHLVAMTKAEHNNELRNLQPAIDATIKRYKEMTHCHKGHEFNEENTRYYITTNGYRGRKCRACHREAARKKKGSGHHRGSC